MELSAKIGTDRTAAIVSLYWSPWGLPLKQSINRISCKSILVDPIKSSRTWKKMKQSPKLHALQYIKTNSPETTNSINAHDWGYKWVVTPKDKKKANPLANQNVRSVTKSVVSFQSFPVSLRDAFAPKELRALKHGTKMNRDNKSVSWNDKLNLDA